MDMSSMSGGPAAAAAATQQNEQQQLKVDDHYRAYLGARINVMLWWMLLLSGGMVAVMTGSLNPVDAMQMPSFTSSIVVATGAIFFFVGCVLPITFQKRLTLQPSYRSISSTVAQPQAVSTLTYPLQLVFRRPNRSITLAIASRYLLASSVTTATYVIGNRLRQGDESGDLGFFQPTHRYPYHLNEKLLFVIGANVVFGCGLAVWDVASGKWNKPSGSRSKEQPQVQIITKLRPVLLRGMAFSAVHAFACFAIYYVFRRTAWSLLLNNTGGLLRPFIGRFARTYTKVGLRVVLRSAALHFFTIIAIETPSVVFDVLAARPLDFSPLSKKGMTSADWYLVGALKSRDDFLLNFTLNEIRDVSYNSERRQAILGDLSSKPTLWQALSQGLLGQLKTSLSILTNRNSAAAGSVPSAAPAANTSTPSPFQTLPIEKLEKPVFLRPTPASPLQASEAQVVAVSQAIDDKVTATTQAMTSVPDLVSRAKRIGGQVIGRLAFDQEKAGQVVKRIESKASEAVGSSQVAANASASLGQVVHSLQPIARQATNAGHRALEVVQQIKASDKPLATQGLEMALRSHWLNDVAVFGQAILGGINAWERTQDVCEPWVAKQWARSKVLQALPRRQVDVNAIKALAAFMVASVHEDTYGQVQHDVPSILDAMASYHYQLVALENEMMQQARARDETLQAMRSTVENKVEQGRRIAQGAEDQKDASESSSEQQQQQQSSEQAKEQSEEIGGRWWQDSVRRAWSEEAAEVQKTIRQAISYTSEAFGRDLAAFTLSSSVKRLVEELKKEPSPSGTAASS